MWIIEKNKTCYLDISLQL